MPGFHGGETATGELAQVTGDMVTQFSESLLLKIFIGKLPKTASLSVTCHPFDQSLRVQLDCSLRKSDESTGLELQCRIDSSRGRIPMIFITAHDDPAVRVQFRL